MAVPGSPGQHAYLERDERLIQVDTSGGAERASSIASAGPEAFSEAADGLPELFDAASLAGIGTVAPEAIGALVAPIATVLPCPGGEIELLAVVRCGPELLAFGRAHGPIPPDLAMTLRLPGAVALPLDWQRLAHADGRDHGTQAAAGGLRMLRFVASGAVGQQPLWPVVKFEISSAGGSRSAWVAVRDARDRDVEQLARDWRPIELVDGSFLEAVHVPLQRSVIDTPVLLQERRFGKVVEASGVDGITVLIVAGAAMEPLHRSLLAAWLTARPGLDEIAVISTNPLLQVDLVSHLSHWADLYGWPVRLISIAGRNEPQCFARALTSVPNARAVAFRAGCVPHSQGWLREIDRSLAQQGFDILVDRVPRMPGSSELMTPDAIAFNLGAVSAVELDSSLRTLEAGWAGLALAAEAGGVRVGVSSHLDLRREPVTEPAPDLSLPDRRSAVAASLGCRLGAVAAPDADRQASAQ